MNVVAAIIIVILLVIWKQSTVASDYLYGFWVAEGDEFCESADIDSIMLFIGKPYSESWKERAMCMVRSNCYLVIMDNMCNQGLTLKYRRGPFSAGTHFTASVEFAEDPVWPEEVTIDVSVADGTLTITHDGTTYARLYKQHDTTHMAKRIDDAGQSSD